MLSNGLLIFFNSKLINFVILNISLFESYSSVAIFFCGFLSLQEIVSHNSFRRGGGVCRHRHRSQPHDLFSLTLPVGVLTKC